MCVSSKSRCKDRVLHKLGYSFWCSLNSVNILLYGIILPLQCITGHIEWDYIAVPICPPSPFLPTISIATGTKSTSHSNHHGSTTPSLHIQLNITSYYPPLSSLPSFSPFVVIFSSYIYSHPPPLHFPTFLLHSIRSSIAHLPSPPLTPAYHSLFIGESLSKILYILSILYFLFTRNNSEIHITNHSVLLQVAIKLRWKWTFMQGLIILMVHKISIVHQPGNYILSAKSLPI